jgi:hypothetical protein
LTSWLLGLDGGLLAGQLHADVLIPVLGLKRCVDAANGYGMWHIAVLGQLQLRLLILFSALG